MNLNATLSKREDQLAIGVVLGLCKKEIANELSVSPRTTEAITRNAIKKIDGKKSVDLAVFWLVKHFQIPVEALPTSITAMIFLLLWIPSEFLMHSSTLRNRIPTSREKIEETRSRRAEESDFTIEL